VNTLYVGIAVLNLVAGAVHGGSFGQAHGGALQFAAFIAFGASTFWLRSRNRPAVLFVSIAFFWLASYGMGLRWMAGTVLNERALGPVLGSMVYAMMITGLSMVGVLCLWGAVLLSAKIRSYAIGAALFASALCVADLLRELIMPSFPWLHVGYAHVDSPFAKLLPLAGVQADDWAIEFVAFLIAANLLSLAVKRSVHPALLIADVSILLLFVGLERVGPFTHPATPLQVALMQTAVAPPDKFRASLLGKHIAEIADFADLHRAQLVVAPETAVPTTLRALTGAQEHYLERGVDDSRALLFGAFAEDSQGDVFNSAVLLQRLPGPPPTTQRTVYIKQHLSPIGEYAPTGFGWIAELFGIPLSNLHSTRDSPRNFLVFGITIIPSVCQDLLYGEDLRTTTNSPRIVVNLSNLAFFSNALARDEFLGIARARALEQQVPVLLTANFGPTASIGADGNIDRQLPNRLPGALEIGVTPHAGVTPYARFGNLFLYLALALSTVSVLVALLRPLPAARA
jgi:apolipoprotein N-acyltransferase